MSPTKLWSSQIRFKNFWFKKEFTSRKFEFKGRQKISGWKWRFWFKIWFKEKRSPIKLWSSQNPVQNPGSRRIYLLQKVKGCRRGPAALTRGSNMGIMPYGLIFIWSLGGFLFKHRCIHQREHSITTLLMRLSSQYYHKSTALVTSVIRLSSQYYHKGPKRVCFTAQLKHGYALSIAHNITWGLCLNHSHTSW